jgi:hypothetical protein
MASEGAECGCRIIGGRAAGGDGMVMALAMLRGIWRSMDSDAKIFAQRSLLIIP